MSAESRLDRLYPALSAKERARLALHAWKEGRDPDPALRRTVPEWQIAGYNKYVELMCGASGALSHYIMVVSLLVGQVELRFGMLQGLHLWAIHDTNVMGYFFLETGEPITKSQHAALVKRTGGELIALGEAAAICCEASERDAPWARRLKAKRAELSVLFDKGTLLGKRRGKQVLIERASLYAWLGEEMPLLTDEGCDYDVFPDAKAEYVERLRAARNRVVAKLRRAPLSLVIDPTLLPAVDLDAEEGHSGDELAAVDPDFSSLNYFQDRFL